MEWYYAKKNEQRGPVSGSTLRSMIISGEVAGTDLVWRNGMQDWAPAAEIRDFEPDQETEIESPAVSQDPSQVPKMVGQPLDYTDPAQFFPAPPVSVRAIVSLICGIVGVMGCVMVVPVLASIAAVVLGHLERSEKGLNPGQPRSGDGVALTGLILGYIGIVLTIPWLLVLLLN